MDEATAKTKWCPQSGTERPETSGTWFFRKLCIASDCMMWRWTSDSESLNERSAVHESVVSHWEKNLGYKKGIPAPEYGENWFWMEPPPPKLKEGGCGLSGRQP